MTSIIMMLREERNRLGLSQAKLGGLAGVTKQSQMLYEKGTRRPDAHYLEAMVKAGVDILYVITSKRSNDSWDATWKSILITTVDELNATNKKISGVKLIELINLLTTWHLQGTSVDPEMVRKQVLLVT